MDCYSHLGRKAHTTRVKFKKNWHPCLQFEIKLAFTFCIIKFVSASCRFASFLDPLLRQAPEIGYIVCFTFPSLDPIVPEKGYIVCSTFPSLDPIVPCCLTRSPGVYFKTVLNVRHIVLHDCHLTLKSTPNKMQISLI